MKKKKIRVTLFINPNVTDVAISKKIGANCVELHTGKYCNLFKKNKKFKSSFENIKKSSNLANILGLDVHAGHGLTYKSTYNIAKIKNISEFNIGHFIISDSVFIGLKKTIKKFKNIINN